MKKTKAFKKIPNWVINLSLVLVSVVFCFLLLEIACRIFPWSESHELQMNNPYYYIETIGQRKPHIPFYTYKERVPLQFDHQSYYAPTDGIVCFHSNQFGARWTEPKNQELKALKILVLGDSFTYGHGLHYEHTFVYRLEKKLEQASYPVSFLNFAKRGAHCMKCFEIYTQFKDTIPHDAVLYGLHINDLVKFPTSYFAANPIAIPWIVKWSKGLDFIAKRINSYFIRKYRINRLRSTAIFEEQYFLDNMNALINLRKAANKQGARLYVVVLPILFDLKKHTLQPLYDGLKSRLDNNNFEYFDLTECLNNFHDKDVWILPFDQHPNQRANEVFSDRLFIEFRKRGIINDLLRKKTDNQV